MKNNLHIALGLALIGCSVTSAYGMSHSGSTGQVIGKLGMDVQGGDHKDVEVALATLAREGVDVPQLLNSYLSGSTLLLSAISQLSYGNDQQVRIIELLLGAGADPTYVPEYFAEGTENPIEKAECFSNFPTNSSQTKERYLTVIKMLKSYKK